MKGKFQAELRHCRDRRDDLGVWSDLAQICTRSWIDGIDGNERTERVNGEIRAARR